MKTILVPVDFSASSHNAAAYSVDLANGRAFDEIVLMANIHISLLEQFLPNPDLIQLSAEDSQRRKKLLLQRLEELKLRLLKKLNPGILIRVILSELPLIRSILEQVKKNGACLVVIGSNSAKIEGSSIGQQLIELTKVIPVPVLIVPPESRYRPMTDALVAGEFSSFSNVEPLGRLEKIREWHPARLLLINTDTTKKGAGPDELSQEKKQAFNRLLQGVDHELTTLHHKDILQGVIQFADERDVPLIIALPGKHSFLYRLTHQNIEHGLSLNSKRPVLILK